MSFNTLVTIKPAEDGVHCGDCLFSVRGAMGPDACLVFEEELESNLGDLIRCKLCVQMEEFPRKGKDEVKG